MKKILYFTSLLVCSWHGKAQVGIGTTTPRAALEIKSGNSGFLAPQVALTSTSVALPVVNPLGGDNPTPVDGTIVYNTNTAGDVLPGYYFWSSTVWKRMTAGLDNWSLSGNSGTTAGTNFAGTTDATDFVIKTNSTERMRATSQGTLGIGTAAPRAAVEISSSTSGLLAPQVALSSAAVYAPVVNPQTGSTPIEGTLVYNTATAGSLSASVSPGYYYWNGTVWNRISGNSPGDIKHGFQTGDHDGWILLDGRAKSTLSAAQQSAATALGIGTNLPDARDAFLKGKKTGESLATATGSNSVTIAAQNLPVLSGTTANDGGHSHNDIKLANISILSSGSIDLFSTNGNNGTSSLPTNGTSGQHSHTVTVNSGSANSPISTIPSSIIANTFIYLGN